MRKEGETLDMEYTPKWAREAAVWFEGNSRRNSWSDKKGSISNPVPLCLPNNYTWDSDTHKIFVDKTKPRKTLTVCKEGLELLESLKDQLVVVLCIAGPAKSGKSFFASQLLEDVNFDVGHGAGSHTAGIWIGVGSKPISCRSDKARVVVLDAEGLGGVNTDSSYTDAKWEHKIFSLCVLLSSYVIYNSKGPPNYDELDKLGFIAEFSRSIFRERQKDVDKQKTPREGFDQFGPDFLWLLRDILCTPDLNGYPCDWTQFVKRALLDPKPNETERNNIRKSITSTFRTIRAADIPPPTFDSKAVKDLLAVVNKDKINQEFFPRIAEVVENILSSVQIKHIQRSKPTGQHLIDMLLHSVDTVNSECDKLVVTSMWDGIVNTKMQRYVQSALDLYKEEMEQVELPEEEEIYLKLHESKKDSSKAHFEKVTKRFDKQIRSNQLHVLCDKIEIEFNKSLLIKNEQASLIFNNKLLTDLENNYFNRLLPKPSCMQLKTADEKINDCYKKMAKGPKAEQVKSNTQLQRGQKIGRMRTDSLIYAEQQSCELFEKSFKQALEGEPLIPSELNALKKTCIIGCFNSFRRVSCNDMDCTPCMKHEQSLNQKVESIFDKCSLECYDKSEKACQCLINELIKRKLLPFVINIDSHNYSDFLKMKCEILTQYDIEAKGLPKGDLMGTCSKTIDMQNEGIQLSIMQSALKSVTCEYTKTLNLTAKCDPCEVEELDKMLALKRRDMISAFKVKCEGIDKSTVEPYQLNLEDVIKNFTTWIANENKHRSINLCVDLVTSLSRDFHDGILQTHIPQILRETEHSQCSDHLQKAEEFKHKILYDYEKKACGPQKERFQQSLNKYLEIHLIIVKEAVNAMILKTVLQHHFYQLDTIKQKYPISETELQSAISETNKNTGKEFIDAQKQISLPFISYGKNILSIILNLDTVQLVEENYKESRRQLESICKHISLDSRTKCEELVGDGEADTAKFAQIKDECTQEFEKIGKGVLKDHYKSILQDNLDVELRIARTTIADNNVNRIFADCRTAIENLVQINPRERDDLEKDISSKKDDARKKIKNLQNKVAEAKITVTEEMLTIQLKDTISYVHGKNFNISSEKCYAQLREVLKALTSRCKKILDNEKSTVEALCNIKAEFLRRYENGAIGPAKETVKEALEKEIDIEIQRTYALFAKASYRETLLAQTEAFQYGDQVYTSGEVNLNELTEHLEKESKDILLRYPGLGDKLKNDLSKDLRKKREFYLIALKQKITITSQVANYRSSIETLIEALIKDGPCEEEHLNKQIEKKRKEAWERIEKTLTEVEQTDFALTEGMLKKAMEDITRNIETQNHNLSTTICSSALSLVSEELKGYCKNFLESDTSVIDNLRHLKIVYLRKYDEVAIGPAKAKERKTLDKKIVEEVDRTFVLFAKAKYREILRVQTEAFKYEDQIKTSVEVNLNEVTKLLEKESKDILLRYPVLVDKLKNDLSKDLRKEREFYLKVLKQKITLTSEVAKYRSSIEALIKDGPCEEEHLKQQIDRKRKETWERIENTFKEVEQTNFALTVGMLEKAMEDITRNIETQNHILSTTKCNSSLVQVLEELRGDCQNFLASDTSEIVNLRHFKDKFLRKYDEVAIGPAKADERNKLEKEIVEEVDRTFVLSAKAKYRELLQRKIALFQFTDLLNNPEPVSIGTLVQRLKEQVRVILNTYPMLEETTRSNLTRDLEESINLSLLKELLTAYENKITNLRNRGILEEDELRTEIDTANRGFFEILGTNVDLPEESRTFITNVEQNFKLENSESSRINCQHTIDKLFQYKWDYITKEFLKKRYNETCKGPARQEIWETNKARIFQYYDSVEGRLRQLTSPIRYYFQW